MPGKLLIADQGNTSVKYSVFSSDGRPLDHARGSAADPWPAQSLLERHPDIEAGIYSSVGRIDLRLVETLRHLLADNLLTLTHSTPLPLTLLYATPATLGADRVAAAAGAALLCPDSAALIADAGTALTLDLLLPGAVFAGGTISPGMEMRFSSLNAGTARLPLLGFDGNATPPPFPDTTAGAIVSGVVRGLCAEIRCAHAAARGRSGAEPRLFITGGDAPALIDTRLLDDLNPIHQPHLVAYGLNSIFRHNETIS